MSWEVSATASPELSWQQANQRYLVAALRALQRRLENPNNLPSEGDDPLAPAGESASAAGSAPTPLELTEAMAAPPAYETLCQAFRLSRFESAVVLLAAGVELDAGLAEACAKAQRDPLHIHPTFGLALAALPEPHWSALIPTAPLRHWRLVELGPGPSLVTRPVHIDERVLHHLTGLRHLDERLASLAEPVLSAGALPPSHMKLVEHVVSACSAPLREGGLRVIQLCGQDLEANRQLAATACGRLGLELAAMPANLVPSAPAELDELVRLWQREFVLGPCALLVECPEPQAEEQAQRWAVDRFLESLGGAVFVSTRDFRRGRKPALTLEVARPSGEEQRQLWRAALGEWATALDGHVEPLVAQFDLGADRIRTASQEAISSSAKAPENLARSLWVACCRQARNRIDDLAQRLVPRASWADLVLPEPQLASLRQIAIQVRRRYQVLETWGFAARSARGLGVSALFCGPSGTGKTMAAEVLAGDLGLDLYRVDLSQVVSKYIGETEKHLRRIFDAADEGGVMLLFDEADALFGKRTEIRDSHDRYANIEVSYLLQRMEAYHGLAILTTNMRSALDAAFLRRIRFVVQFPFPDLEQRTQIWRGVFPAATPTEGVDPRLLARLNVAGGNIVNIALNAAFLAADSNVPVRMGHLVQAARAEFAKLEKPLSELDISPFEVQGGIQPAVPAKPASRAGSLGDPVGGAVSK